MENSPRCKKILELVKSAGLPHFRAVQALHNIYRGKATSFSQMKNLSPGIRDQLEEAFDGRLLTLKAVSTTSAPNAEKVLFKLADEHAIESVYLDFGSHKSLCISSQAGCAFACKFCATGRIGFKRHLTVDEITDQVLFFRNSGKAVDSVSFMGMGEPLGNPRLFNALDVLTDPKCLGFSQRSVNVSTIGIIPALRKLTRLYPQVNVAYSLHSPFKEERDSLVPANKVYPIEDVFHELDKRILKTGRRTWIAYLLLEGLNDTPLHAEELGRLIESRHAGARHLYHVNLLPYNNAKSVKDGFKRLDHSSVTEFQRRLLDRGISTSCRNSFGSLIDAACGQLHAGYDPS